MMVCGTADGDAVPAAAGSNSVLVASGVGKAESGGCGLASATISAASELMSSTRVGGGAEAGSILPAILAGPNFPIFSVTGESVGWISIAGFL